MTSNIRFETDKGANAHSGALTYDQISDDTSVLRDYVGRNAEGSFEQRIHAYYEPTDDTFGFWREESRETIVADLTLEDAVFVQLALVTETMAAVLDSIPTRDASEEETDGEDDDEVDPQGWCLAEIIRITSEFATGRAEALARGETGAPELIEAA
jgi:hypothetical protein